MTSALICRPTWWLLVAFVAPLSCASARSLDDGFRRKVDAGCNSYESCQALVQQSIERSKACREGEAGYVSCAEARTDHRLAMELFAPYERSAAYAARLDQERRQREEAERRQAELRRTEEELQRREQERLRAEGAARAGEREQLLALYRAMTPRERQAALIDCYRAGGEYRAELLAGSRGCESLLADLLTVAASEQEREALSSTWGRLEAEVDSEIQKLQRQEEAAQRRDASERAAQHSQSAPNAGSSAAAVSDAQVRKALIAESLDGYSGNCPCPYDTDRAGRRCGKRSAHSRAGGEAPLCFDSDITQGMIDAYRKRNVH